MSVPALVFVVSAATSARAQSTVLLVDVSSPEVDPALRRQVLSGLSDTLRRDSLEVRRYDGGGAAGAAPANVARDVQAHLAAAKQLSQQFKEGEALARLKQAEQLFRKSLARTRDVALLVAVLLARARLEIDRGNKQAASWALTRVAVLDPNRTLDAGAFKPVTLRIYNSIRKRIARETGELRVKSSPTGLPIWIDGKRRGSGPTVVTLPAGEHFVHVVGGGAMVGRVVSVGWKSSGELALALAPGPQSDNDLRAVGKSAEVAYVIALRVRRRAGNYQVRARVIDVRTVDTPSRVKSKPFAADASTSAVSALAVRLLPLLGAQPKGKPRGDDGDPDGSGSGSKGSESIFKTWWFWTIVGAAAVGGGVAIGVAATADGGVRLRLAR